MKNFPHQINQIPKVIRCLQDYYNLELSNQDFNDDVVYGYAMARNRNYNFRGMGDASDEAIEEKIVLEMNKPPGDQGARTCARDLRRMFILMGFIDPFNHKLTELGLQMLDIGSDLDNPEVVAIWRNVLLDTVVDGVDETISHPYRILLKLLNDNPGLVADKLSLALEARDDSDAEYTRVLELSRRDDWDNIVTEIGTTTNKVKNAVKILPSMGKQIGDIKVERNLYYLVDRESNVGDDVQGGGATNEFGGGNEIVADGGASYQPRRSLRRASSENIANTQIDIDLDLERYDTTVDLSASIQTRQRRTVQHHELVKKIALHFEELGYHIYENQIDCLAVKPDIAILIEVKTLNGESKDERNQVMKALSQVYYYESFNLDEFSRYPTVKVACFSSKPSDLHIKFLEDNDCFVMWVEEETVFLSEAFRQSLQN